MYFAFSTRTFYALKLPHSDPPQYSAEVTRAFTDEHKTVNLNLTGTVTSNMISNAYLTASKNAFSTHLYFTLNHPESPGHSNITIPKNVVEPDTAPTVYINQQKAAEQGYNQDQDNYYVWYTPQNGQNQVTIAFTMPKTEGASERWFGSDVWVYALVGIALVIVAVGVAAVAFRVIRRHSLNKHNLLA